MSIINHSICKDCMIQVAYLQSMCVFMCVFMGVCACVSLQNTISINDNMSVTHNCGYVLMIL